MSYTTISDTGNKLAELLKNNMTPEPIASKDLIKLCNPSERTNEALCIYLYDIKTSEGINDRRMIQLDKHHQQFPPTFLELYYMITPFSNGDARIKSTEEQRILGKVIQIINDNQILTNNKEFASEGSIAGDILITSLPLSIEEQNQIWNFIKGNGKLSLFYKASPVEIQSARTREVKPVREKIIVIDEKQF